MTKCQISVRVSTDGGRTWMFTSYLGGNFDAIEIEQANQVFAVVWEYPQQLTEAPPQDQFRFEVIGHHIVPVRRVSRAAIGGSGFWSFRQEHFGPVTPSRMKSFGLHLAILNKARGGLRFDFLFPQPTLGASVTQIVVINGVDVSPTPDTKSEWTELATAFLRVGSERRLQLRLFGGGGLNSGTVDPGNAEPLKYWSPVVTLGAEIAIPTGSVLSIVSGFQPIWRTRNITGIDKAIYRGHLGIEVAF